MGCTGNTLEHPWSRLHPMLRTTDLCVAKRSRHASLWCVFYDQHRLCV